MASPNKKLAEALRALKRLQVKQHCAIESGDLKDAHRLILVEEGFLRPVMKGWYVCSSPGDQKVDTTAWYASFWPFLSGYLKKRFGKRYCLNVDVSLLIHTQSTIIPKQVTVITKEGGTSVLNLPHGNSLLIYSDPKNLRSTRVDVNGLQALSLPETLCRLGPQSFRNNPREAEIGLNMIRDLGELLAVLLTEEGMTASAGRLAGAFRFIGRSEDADRILQTMKLSKYDVRESNPFEISIPTITLNRERSPYSMRLVSMWAGWRDAVLDNFPKAPGLCHSAENYLSSVDERYVADAYNSLSIEGYKVTDELIERVAKQGWNPDAIQQDQKDRDTLAARGYYQAFQAVKLSITEILTGKNAGQIVRSAHHRWHGELFAPAVTAGILEPYQLAGYRNGPVYIRNSMHTPLPREALIDAMDTLFNLLEQEPEPAVRAVLGHHLFVFIHPYFDGNGRLGRFLMNAMLASGGYPWTIIRVERREAYLYALERASVDGDIAPLTRFIGDEVKQ
ncbi:Fic family protein [Methylomonas sp. AM2-LC]|uniref:Fic family protein n=1 Tax=Methylomonas sp. AM2-LC TaxID=3153301 RepID=UPI003267C8C0